MARLLVQLKLRLLRNALNSSTAARVSFLFSSYGALIVATVHLAPPGNGVGFRAGKGVGTVTRPGLPLPPGEPAINPVPRDMIRAAIAEVAAQYGGTGDAEVPRRHLEA